MEAQVNGRSNVELLTDIAERAIQVLARCALEDGEDLRLGYRVTQSRMVKALETIIPTIRGALSEQDLSPQH